MVTWVVATRAVVLGAGHPAYPVLLGLVTALGVAASVRPVRRRVLRLVGVVGLVLVLAAVLWLRPYAADPVALEGSSAGVQVVETATTWELRPRAAMGAGVVFVPGALVDPRAYLALLRPLAEAGHTVVVLTPPLGISLTAPGAPLAAIDAHPDVPRWVVAGHSLGGVTASTTAAAGDPRVRGLLLWAAYPQEDLSGSGIAVASISGDRDALATPDDIAASRAKLPPDTAFTAIPGGVHAYFGDYGPQAGDGTPATSRATAQQLIIEASTELADRIG